MNRIQRIYDELLKLHGPQGWWPIVSNKSLLCEYGTKAPNDDPEKFEICVGATLTQNTSWYPGVVRAIQQLKRGRVLSDEERDSLRLMEFENGILHERPKRFNSDAKRMILQGKELSPDYVLHLSNLPELIRPAGYFNQKAKKLRIFAEFYKKLDHAPSREELLSLWGVGKETADSMLLYAFGQPEFVVDAYTKRLLLKLGLVGEKAAYDEMKKIFEDNLPRDVEMFREFHALIVQDGKKRN